MSLETYFSHRAAEAEEDRQWYADRPGNWRHEREAEEERDYWRARAESAHSHCTSSSHHSHTSSYHSSSSLDDDFFFDDDDE